MTRQTVYLRQNRLLAQRLDEKGALVAAHRGCRAGNIAGNTLPAFLAAFRMGADIAETDVIRSTDGVLYTFHDGTESYALHDGAFIKTLDSREIERRQIYNSLDEPSGYCPTRLCEVLERFRGDALFNIDRAWDIFPELDALLQQYPDAIGQVLFKAPLAEDALDFLARCPRKYMFMPIVDSPEDIAAALEYTGINIVGVEARVRTPDAALFADEAIRAVTARGLFVWANALTLRDDYRGFGGLDDDCSVIRGPEYGWGAMFAKGIRVVQTDWPALLVPYRDAYFARVPV